MSIALLITGNNLPKDVYIPVATEDAFDTYWKPACDALALKRIPIIKDPGINVRPEDYLLVISELGQVKAWMSNNLSLQQARRISDRIDRVIAEIETVFKGLPQGQPYPRVYIG